MFDNLRDTLDFDDLLFEGRNKEYGAYQLRRKYNAVIVAGILLAVFLTSLTVILPFILSPHTDKIHSGGFSYVQVQMENLDPPMDEIIVPPPPPPPEAAQMSEVVKYIAPVVVDTLMPMEPSQTSTDEFLVQSTTDNNNISVQGTGNGEEVFTGQGGTETDEAFFLVEVMPSFKGGDLNKFRDWVTKRTNYPQAAIENKIQGRVFLTFIIETDGTLSNVTVVKGVDPLIDNEAVRAIKASPKWSPGLQRGQPVRVRYSMWLNFAF